MPEGLQPGIQGKYFLMAIFAHCLRMNALVSLGTQFLPALDALHIRPGSWT